MQLVIPPVSRQFRGSSQAWLHRRTEYAIEYRYTEGKIDRFSELAAELVHLKVDIIVAAGGRRLVQAAKNATKTIPIVMTGGEQILSKQASLKASPVPAATSPALQPSPEN